MKRSRLTERTWRSSKSTLGICSIALGLALATMPSLAQAQYYNPQGGYRDDYGRPRGDGYRPSRGLICVVAPEYRRSRSSCAVGGYGKQPGDYCECRLYNYGPTVPGVIMGR